MGILYSAWGEPDDKGHILTLFPMNSRIVRLGLTGSMIPSRKQNRKMALEALLDDGVVHGFTGVEAGLFPFAAPAAIP
jgi:hypothetical protein